jgi:hypothetical protein
VFFRVLLVGFSFFRPGAARAPVYYRGVLCINLILVISLILI